MCAHPCAAWRVSPVSGRLTIFVAYALVAYLTILGVLLF
jgi:hypothetical protein